MDDQPQRATPKRDDLESKFSEHRVVLSEDLLQGSKEIWIRHHGELYRLRETRAGGLILGK